MQREWEGLDGIRGPTITGCNFYMKREAFYGMDTIPKGSHYKLLYVSYETLILDFLQ